MLTDDISGVTLSPWLTSEEPKDISTNREDFVPLKKLKEAAPQPDPRPLDCYSLDIDCISRCNSLEDFKILSRQWRAQGGQRVEINSSILQSLLARNASIQTILDFFEDAEPNDGDISSISHLLAYLSQRASPRSDDDETFSNWIQMQIVLGYIPFQNITTLLSSIDKIDQGREGSLSRAELYAKVVDGVRRCTIHGSPGAKERALTAILFHITQGTLMPKIRRLGWEIIKILSETSALNATDEISLSMSRLIIAWNPLKSCKSSEQDIDEDLVEILRILRTFPDHLAQDFVQRASSALITRLQSYARAIDSSCNKEPSQRKLQIEHISRWWSLLQDEGFLSQLQQRPGWQQLERSLGSQPSDVIVTYVRHMDHMAQCSFLLRHYRQPVSDLVKSGGKVDVPATAVDQFIDICNEYPDRSPFVNLLLTLRLTKGHRACLVRDLFGIINVLGLSGTTLEIVKSHSTAHIWLDTRLVAQQINYYLEQNEPRIAYRLFQVFPVLALEHVPALAEAIIENPEFPTHVAFKYRHSRQRWLEQMEPHNSDPHYLTHIRTQLLNRMAKAYSRWPRKHTVAFRNVYKCYVALRISGLPLTAEYTKALTFAGIVRFFKKGDYVSKVRCDKIRSLVREAEGEDISDRLADLIYFWRGKYLEQIKFRRIKERALGLPRDALLVEESRDGLKVTTNPAAVRNRRQRAHWYKDRHQSHFTNLGIVS